MAYLLVSNVNRIKFTEQVREYMLDGWVPQGGVCVEQSVYYQAMVYAPRDTNTAPL